MNKFNWIGCFLPQSRWLFSALFPVLFPVLFFAFFSLKTNARLHEPKKSSFFNITSSAPLPRYNSFHFEIDISAFSNGNAIIQTYDKLGLLDKNGHWLKSPDFSFIGEYSNGLASATPYGTQKYGLIDERGVWVLPPDYSYLEVLSNEFILARDKGDDKFGLIDINGQWMVSPQFSFVGDFVNGVAPAANGYFLEGEIGLIDEKGEWILPPHFDYFDFASVGYYTAYLDHPQVFFSRLFPDKASYENLVIVGYNDKTGLMSSESWEWILPPSFDEIIYLNKNRVLIKEGEEYNLINVISNSQAETLMSLPYDMVHVSRGMLIVELKKPCNNEDFVEPEAPELSPHYRLSGESDLFFDYPEDDYLEDDYYPEDNNYKYTHTPATSCEEHMGLVDFEGRELLKPEFDLIRAFSKEGITSVKKSGKYAFINKKGEFLTEFIKLDYLGELVNGYAPAILNGRAGLMDSKGKWAILPRFDRIGIYSEGLIAAEKGSKKGFINLQGEWLIELDSLSF